MKSWQLCKISHLNKRQPPGLSVTHQSDPPGSVSEVRFRLTSTLVLRGSSNPMQCWGSLAQPEAANHRRAWPGAGSAAGRVTGRGLATSRGLPAWGEGSPVQEEPRRSSRSSPLSSFAWTGRGVLLGGTVPLPSDRQPQCGPRAEGRHGPRCRRPPAPLPWPRRVSADGLGALRLAQAPGGGTGRAPSNTCCRPPLNQDP